MSGRRKRQKREAAACDAEAQRQRPPAPEIEWSNGFRCDGCGLVTNVVTSVGNEDVHLQHPGTCGRCASGRFSHSVSYRILNVENYGKLDGMQFQMRDRPTGKPALDVIWKDEVYRETGELHRYERRFDRMNDLYSKRYTNLVTGEVAVEGVEPLSEHTGRGAARRLPPQV